MRIKRKKCLKCKSRVIETTISEGKLYGKAYYCLACSYEWVEEIK